MPICSMPASVATPVQGDVPWSPRCNSPPHLSSVAYQPLWHCVAASSRSVRWADALWSRSRQLAGRFRVPAAGHPSRCRLLGAALLGGLWGLVPALLKHYIGVNEIIATLLLNPIASVLVGLVRLPRVDVKCAPVAADPEHQTFGWDFCCSHGRSAYLSILWHTTAAWKYAPTPMPPVLHFMAACPFIDLSCLRWF